MGLKKRKRIIAVLVTVVAGIYLAGSFKPVGECCFFTDRPLRVVEKESGFTPLQISIAPQLGGGLFKTDTPVYGMSVGGMVHQKEINGVSVAGIPAFTKRTSGVVNLAEHNRGVQLGIINQEMPDAVIENNFSAPEKPEGFGVQAGIVNYSEGKGLQFGLWNTNPNAWIKHFPLFNFAF